MYETKIGMMCDADWCNKYNEVVWYDRTASTVGDMIKLYEIAEDYHKVNR